MAITSEWILNKDKKKIYPISHAKAIIRGNSTVDADITALAQAIEDKKAGLIEIDYATWSDLSESEQAAMGDVVVTNFPMEFTLGDMEEAVTQFQATSETLTQDVLTLKENVAPLIFNNAGAHNAIYRGKNLGTAVSAAQYAAISSGTFDDMYIGDYWTINGTTYRIAAFDYWLNCGDTACTKHHLVVVPDTCFYNAQMNSSNVTTGGYVGSAMYTANLASAKTTFNTDFGSTHILNHRTLLTNAVSNGYPSGGSWYDSTVDLMNERMVYGGACFTPAANGTTVPYNYTIDKGQLPLFALEPSRICNRNTYWLRDVVTAASFAYVGNDGYPDYSNASLSRGVRPAVGIC